MFEYVEVPRDEDGYTVAFQIHDLDGAIDFLDEYGFVVIEGVLTDQECASTLSEMYQGIEDAFEGFDRNDYATWGAWKSKNYGFLTYEPAATPQILRNRQNENVYQVFAKFLGDRELLVNHDRWCIFRPTLGHEEWATQGNVHLDVNPWKYASEDDSNDAFNVARKFRPRDFFKENNAVHKSWGLNLQAVINLHDNREEDGGFQIVPKFHTYFNEWLREMGEAPPELVDAPSYRFPPKSIGEKRAIRVPVRPGSMVVWNQMCAHGSKRNASGNPRCAQMLKMVPAKFMREDYLRERGRVVEQMVRKAGIEEEVSDTGRQVFGLRYLTKR